MTEHELQSLDADLIARYVAGTLNEEEQDAVELYFFSHPEVLDEIEAEIQLAKGVSEAEDLLQASATSAAPATPAAARSWFERTFGNPWLGLATTSAALMMLLVINLNDAPIVAVAPAQLSLDNVRGVASAHELQIPDSGVVLLRIDTGTIVGGRAKALLIGPQTTTEIELEKPASRIVNLAIDHSVFEPGQYELAIYADDQEVIRYQFITRS